jgi:hypothetical protein
VAFLAHHLNVYDSLASRVHRHVDQLQELECDTRIRWPLCDQVRWRHIRCYGREPVGRHVDGLVSVGCADTCVPLTGHRIDALIIRRVRVEDDGKSARSVVYKKSLSR